MRGAGQRGSDVRGEILVAQCCDAASPRLVLRPGMPTPPSRVFPCGTDPVITLFQPLVLTDNLVCMYAQKNGFPWTLLLAFAFYTSLLLYMYPHLSMRYSGGPYFDINRYVVQVLRDFSTPPRSKRLSLIFRGISHAPEVMSYIGHRPQLDTQAHFFRGV